MDKYSDQCDEFRKTLEQYKLDPGELLPPPAKTRLGVSISTEPAGMFIQRVGEKSRAERIGLKPGDQIKKVDGKDVTNIADLRKAASAKEKGLIIEINREGTDLKLEEKEAKAEPAK
jgi:S1-C subfamily serine protease